MKNKKILAMLLATVMVFSMVACGEEPASGVTTETTGTSEAAPTEAPAAEPTEAPAAEATEAPAAEATEAPAVEGNVLLDTDCEDETMGDVTVGGSNGTGSYYFFDKTGRTTYNLEDHSYLVQEIPAEANKVEIAMTYLNIEKCPLLIYLNDASNHVYANTDGYNNGVDVVVTLEKTDASWNITSSVNGEAPVAGNTLAAGLEDVLYIGNGGNSMDNFYIDTIKITVAE